MKHSFILVTLVLFLAGCTTKENDDTHSHGPEPIAFTLYAEHTELFVEFKPLVKGATSRFATHLTQTGELFTPLLKGNVTVSLVKNGKGIRHTVDGPSSPGIFRPELKPNSEGGDYQLIFEIKTENFTDKIVINNITVYPDEESAMAEEQPPSDGNEIIFLKEQSWKMEFANIPAKKLPFSNIIKTSGQILPAPGDERIIVANTSGIVSFSGNKTIVGSMVNDGAALFTISGGNLTKDNINVIYNEALSAFENAKSNYDRMSELVKDKIVSDSEYREAKLKYENAQIVLNTIKQKHSASGQIVASSMKGFIKSVFVNDGQFVEAGTPLASISKNEKLILQANVSQKYFSELSSIYSANFRTNESDVIYDTHLLNGKLISFGKSVNERSPFIPVTFEFENTGDIIPGTIVEVYLKSKPLPNSIIVPFSSLIEDQGLYFVYIQTSGESFQKREIKTGASDGINIQVLEGLTENERVVTKGAFQIKLSSASGTLPAHGHEH